MAYIDLTTNQYPISEKDIREMNPNTSFTEPFSPEGYAVVFSTPQPTTTCTQIAREIAPVQDPVKLTWGQAWEVVDLVLTPAELAALLEKQKAEKCAALAAYRYVVEVGGLQLPNGMKIATDDRAKTLIAGAQIDATAHPSILTDWKTEEGWVRIDAATVATISAAVAGHVRACYVNERIHCEAINALATVAEVAAYSYSTGWPV
ncbi:MAG: DUF4376 domain-containing protein [Desulfobulbaceae bacterium]